MMDAVNALVSGFTGEGVGKALAKTITLIIEKAMKNGLEGKYILLAIDDVAKPMGLGSIEWCIKWLYEYMQKFMDEHRPKAINIIATTSEGESLRLLFRHNYLATRLIWNLDKESFRELYESLNPMAKPDFEDL